MSRYWMAGLAAVLVLGSACAFAWGGNRATMESKPACHGCSSGPCVCTECACDACVCVECTCDSCG